MTVAFDEFMRQYKMTGSEKADGYSRDAFVGLDEHEKETVFNLLVTELPFSAEWLYFLDSKKALDVMKAKEDKLRERLRSDSYVHVYLLQEQLIKYSEDLLYQSHMIEDYAYYDDDLKPRAVIAVGHTPVNTAAVAFFKQVILTEVNPDAVAQAALELLSALKIPRNTEADKENYRRLVNELRSENTRDKLAAMSQVGKYEASLPVVA